MNSRNFMAENYILSMDTAACVLSDEPSPCRKALAALASPEATSEEIGSIISEDKDITARLLRTTNSAYFGLERKITDVTEAVNLLGFQMVTAMLADLEALNLSRQRQTILMPALASNRGEPAKRNAPIPTL